MMCQESSLYLSHGANLVRTLLSAASKLSNGDEQTLEESLQPLVDFYSGIAMTGDSITVSHNHHKPSSDCSNLQLIM